MMDALFSLDGRTAVVTGSLGLLGREHCAALGRAGARVVVVDRDEAACEAFAAELEMDGIRALGVGADIASEGDVRRLRDRTFQAFDGVDVLVNNAAIDDKFDASGDALERSRFENYPLEAWDRAMRVNVTGTFLCCQVLGAEMAKRGRGSIVNVASTYGVVAPDQSLYQRPDGSQSFFKSAAYPTTKGAVLAFTRYLAAYWGSSGVRVNAISPGGVHAGQDEYFVENYARRTPLGRMARKDELRGALVFLASDASSYVTGANFVVDGGFTAW